jgi:CheY-like chemotaxis protein
MQSGLERKTRVLIAEDDPEMRALLAQSLAEAGAVVEQVPDGYAMRERLTQIVDEDQMPDLVISDVRMPGWSGLDVLRWLSVNHPEIPVILITAFGERETHERARQLGAVAVYDKPLDLDKLRDAALGFVRASADIRRAGGESPLV